jgi:hypothetical protein
MIVDFYPEVSAAGSLTNALNLEFKKISSELRCSDNNSDVKYPFHYVRVERKGRFSQIYLAGHSKLYLPDFWRDGVCLAHGTIDNIVSLAEIINYWLFSECSSVELGEKFQFVTLNDDAVVYDEGREVDYKWNYIHTHSSKASIKNVVELAMKDEVLKLLYPYTSLNTLCFSRCTGYPYTTDTPMISPVSSSTFEVRLSDNTIIGIGSPEEAIKMVKDNLPPGIQPAKPGIASDIDSF